ncbi:MAG: fluoride efflux transporter CrcB [Armatimonadetes bacterium]|nr:fluoride efflux transporter CrcB [Armatimonadota bacterium]
MLYVGIGGFLGSNARYWAGGWLAERFRSSLPYHTFVVNVSGSFLLGFFMALSLYFPWHPRWRWGVAIGFLGGYTTFSTFEYETLQLLGQRSGLYALANMAGSLFFGLAAVWLGLAAGRWITKGLS